MLNVPSLNPNQSIPVLTFKKLLVNVLMLFGCSDSAQQWAVGDDTSSSVTASPSSDVASCSCASSACSVTGSITDRSSVCSFCEDVSSHLLCTVC